MKAKKLIARPIPDVGGDNPTNQLEVGEATSAELPLIVVAKHTIAIVVDNDDRATQG